MPVELGYFTLKVGDLERAKSFYGALFGWRIAHGGHVENTAFPLGLSAGGPADAAFAYFRVEEIEVMARRVEDLGGAVRERHAYPSGANAICADDQGTVFSLWQPAPGF